MATTFPLIDAIGHAVSVQAPFPPRNTTLMLDRSGQLSMTDDVVTKPVGVWTNSVSAGRPWASGADTPLTYSCAVSKPGGTLATHVAEVPGTSCHPVTVSPP